MAERPVNVLTIAEQIPTEADAYLYLERLRWNGTTVCPHCGNVGRCYYIRPLDGTSRKTRTGSQSQRRVWKCGECRKQFSVLTGTVMHGTKIPVRTWIFVIFEMCSSRHGVAAREIERKYGLTAKSAWHMLHRIREAMQRDPLAGLLSGTVVADETFIGGKPKNRHRQGQGRVTGFGKGKSGKGSPNAKPKTAVLSLVDRATGEVRSVVVPDVGRETLRKAIAEQVDMPNTVLYTDGHQAYRQIGGEMAGHEWVDHQRNEYVRGPVSTNAAESFFAQLKRSLDGTHHHVSRKHLHRYLNEFDFRSTTKDISDGARMELLMGQVGGRRLTYKPLSQG